MKKIRKFLLFAVVVLCLFLGLWTAQDNAEPVTVTLLGFSLPEMALGLWLLLMLAAGAALGVLASMPMIFRNRSESRRLKNSQ